MLADVCAKAHHTILHTILRLAAEEFQHSLPKCLAWSWSGVVYELVKSDSVVGSPNVSVRDGTPASFSPTSRVPNRKSLTTQTNDRCSDFMKVQF